MLFSKPTYPVTQRLFWLLRVVTSLFIGAVILGECGGQLLLCPQQQPLLLPHSSLCLRVGLQTLSTRRPCSYPCLEGCGPGTP